MGLFGGIEAGGTKFICAIGTGPDDIKAEIRFPTTEPEETLGRAIEFFRQYMIKTRQRLEGIGIGSFGPLDLNPSSQNFGKITSTPKAGWQFVDIRQRIEQGTATPVVIDTDANAAAVGEGIWGAAVDLRDYLYLTLGTGVGGGIIVQGKPIHGLVHPEIGHMRLPRDLVEDPFEGICPYHGDCLEGLASGPAILARVGVRGETIPEYHPVWEIEAAYISLALANLICILSPQRIILGGGVMQQNQLFPTIRVKVLQLLNNYVQSPSLIEDINSYIVAPKLGHGAGVIGAIGMTKQAFYRKTHN